MSTEHLASDPSLTSYLEGFDAALDSAAITCARCASLEKSLNEAMLIIRDYFYVQTRKQGRKMDERANAFLIKMGAS